MNSKQRERPRMLGCTHPSFCMTRNNKGRIVEYICEERLILPRTGGETYKVS
jgi:hypothetical protein